MSCLLAELAPGSMSPRIESCFKLDAGEVGVDVNSQVTKALRVSRAPSLVDPRASTESAPSGFSCQIANMNICLLRTGVEQVPFSSGLFVSSSSDSRIVIDLAKVVGKQLVQNLSK